MIKGINRQVVEVSETGSEYFERILFFVKPEQSNVSEGKLRERASAIAGGAGKPPITKIRRNKFFAAAKLAAAAAAGAAVTGVAAAFIN